MRRLLAALSACVLLGACAAVPPPPRADADGTREILVMLRAPLPHYRADGDYTAGYSSRAGREGARRTADKIAADNGLSRVDDWPMPALGLDCFVMRLPDGIDATAALAKLKDDPRVESAQAMNTFHVLAHDDPLFSLQPSAKLWRLSELHVLTTGRNVRVAEIDSGVDTEHPDLEGRVTTARNFVTASPDKPEAHGTAVAGIIAARADDAIGIAGVAPQAKLFALRACWEIAGQGGAARCNSFTLAKALQFSIEADAQIINLSVGGPRDRLLERLLDRAIARGIAVVGAVDPAASDGGFPAGHPGVLAIGDAETADGIAVLRAPGRDIPAPVPGRAWSFVSGTSYAAAEATGLVALLRELSPSMPASQMKELLARGASGVEHGAMIDACDAVARVSGQCACQCAVARDTRPGLPR